MYIYTEYYPVRNIFDKRNICQQTNFNLSTKGGYCILKIRYYFKGKLKVTENHKRSLRLYLKYNPKYDNYVKKITTLMNDKCQLKCFLFNISCVDIIRQKSSLYIMKEKNKIGYTKITFEYLELVNIYLTTPLFSDKNKK